MIAALKQLFGHFSQRRRRQLVLVMVLMLGGAVAEVLTLGAVLPFIALMADPGRAASYPQLQTLFGALGWANPDQIRIPVTILFASIVVIAAAFRLLLTWVSQKYVFRLGHDLSVDVYRRILYQPYSYHVSKNSSELMAGIAKVQQVMSNVLMPMVLMIMSVIISIFILGALITIDAAVALVALVGFGLIYLGIIYVTRRRLQANSGVIARTQSERIKTLQEGFGGIRDLLIDQAQPVYMDKFRRVDLQFRDAQMINTFIGAAPYFVIQALAMVLIAGLALVLSSSSGGFSVALPVLGALALGAQRLLPMLQQIYLSWAKVTGAQQVLYDVCALLAMPVHERQSILDNNKGMSFELRVTLKDLMFFYDKGAPPVLDKVNLTINKGTHVGFIGLTGSGKSTLVDLVMGLLQPTTGGILIDGIPLTADNVSAWQRNIAHVPQAIYLSDTTIAQNIAFGMPPEKIDAKRVRDAANCAEITKFIDGLPDGFETIVGERGVRLSGGQRQRIGIARALYKQTELLVLDEATSALDGITEKAVMDAIRKMGHSKTIILIAHRLSTVQFCDIIFLLDQGRLKASGSFNELLETSEDFRRMVNSHDG